MDNVLNLLIPFAGNLVSCLVLVLGIYHVISKRRDYVFSFILVSSAVYLLCNLLMAVEIDLAFALGLFAIFGIIRYRTDAIPIREMTYLFIVIALSVLNALAPAATGMDCCWCRQRRRLGHHVSSWTGCGRFATWPPKS